MSKFPAVFATLVVSLSVASPGCNSRRHPTIDPRATLGYLASDEVEGRGPGTQGLDRAGDYIASQFQSIGLKKLPGQTSWFQPFEITTATEIGPATALRVGDRAFTAGEDFSPLGFSKTGAFEGDVVFVGYGITSSEHEYDDYAGVDVKGKVVLAMRYEPHDAKGKSKFDDKDWSEAAALTAKANRAKEAGAAALLLVTPPDIGEDDQLLGLSGRSGPGSKDIAVLHVKRTVAEELLKRGGVGGLKSFVKKIDASGPKPAPASFPLSGVRVAGNVDIVQKKTPVRNVMAYLPGKKADEYVVVGAHYDHLGRGMMGSLRRPSEKSGKDTIHNGADDNASGTTAILSLASQLARKGKPERSILFVAFTAEEEGLLGSGRFVNNPPVPLEKIVAMINLDMVGRIRTAGEQAASSTTKQTTAEAATQKSTAGVLYVGGMGTAAEFDGIVKRADARSPLVVTDIGRGGVGPSDHASFAMKKIPVLFLFSGLHGDYHRPSDEADKVNYDGLAEVVDFARDLVTQIAAAPKQAYVSASDASPMRVGGTGGRSRVTLGVMPDYSTFDQRGGVRVGEAMPGTPAAAAGIKAKDVIVKFDDKTIDTLYDLSDVLAKGKPGQNVKLQVIRPPATQPIEIEATLKERKD